MTLSGARAVLYVVDALTTASEQGDWAPSIQGPWTSD